MIMKLSNKVKVETLKFLAEAGIMNLETLILKEKLKLPLETSYEFSVDGLGIVIMEIVKRINELMPPNISKKIIIDAAKDAGRDFVFELKARGLSDKTVNHIDKGMMLFFQLLKMKYDQVKLTENESVYLTKCPFVENILKEQTTQFCLICQNFCQGMANMITKGCKVEILKNEKNKHCKFVIKRKLPKNLLLKEKFEIPLDMAYELAIKELGRIIIKIGKKVVKKTNPETSKAILFWGGRNAGTIIGKMIKDFGIKGEKASSVEASTTLFAGCLRMRYAQIEMTKERNIGHVFECPWVELILKEKVPKVCMVCEGFCQGIVDVVARDFTVKIPKKMSKGNRYCQFIYEKVK